MKQKCEKCDERGYINDSLEPEKYHSAHSCECGWAIEQSMKKFEGISIDELLAYGHKRVIEKSK